MALTDYTGTLVRVSAEHDARPVDSFDPMERIGSRARAWCEYQYGDIPFASHMSSMPLRVLARLSLDEIAKMHHSSDVMMDQSVNDYFEQNPKHRIITKISSSAWRWGFTRPGWNEMVDAYEGVRSFDLGLDGFEVRLDHSTYNNECGWSEHSRTFLDGALAYLVYHRGEHVMTIGFSFAGKGRLLISQVQLRQQRGNRWLFRWPKNRLEYIIGRFEAAFPAFSLWVVDGGTVGGKNLKSYYSCYQRCNKTIRRLREDEAKGRLASWDKGRMSEEIEQRRAYRDKIRHLRADLDRLTAQYRETGRYRLTSERHEANALIHYRVDSSVN